ncbi:MAG: hypothetical protein ACC662_01865, partial [Planctomycetota bacterium]
PPPPGGPLAIEADASSAAPWWAAAALTGGWVEVENLPRTSRQADAVLADILERMGARIGPASTAHAFRLEGPGVGDLRAPGDVDLSNAPDLLPLVGALGAVAAGRTRITGVAHARLKESDRLATTAAAVRALGGRVEVFPERGEMRLEGGVLGGGHVDAAGDHRLVLAFGVLGLVVPQTVLCGAEAVAKSHPGFLGELARRTGGDAGGEPGRRNG